MTSQWFRDLAVFHCGKVGQARPGGQLRGRGASASHPCRPRQDALISSVNRGYSRLKPLTNPLNASGRRPSSGIVLYISVAKMVRDAFAGFPARPSGSSRRQLSCSFPGQTSGSPFDAWSDSRERPRSTHRSLATGPRRVPPSGTGLRRAAVARPFPASRAASPVAPCPQHEEMRMSGPVPLAGSGDLEVECLSVRRGSRCRRAGSSPGEGPLAFVTTVLHRRLRLDRVLGVQPDVGNILTAFHRRSFCFPAVDRFLRSRDVPIIRVWTSSNVLSFAGVNISSPFVMSAISARSGSSAPLCGHDAPFRGGRRRPLERAYTRCGPVEGRSSYALPAPVPLLMRP